MKITTKTTKEQLKSIIGANVKEVKEKDKELFDRIAYADKMMKKDDSKVTRKDLVDLAKEVITLLGDAVINPFTAPQATPVAENATKKLTAKGKTQKKADSEEVGESEETAEELQETPVSTPKAEAKGAEKKSAKKSSLGKKKEQPKKDGVTVLEDKKSKKAVQLAKQFPLTFDIDGKKYELASDLKTMEDVYNALEGDEPQELIFAHYWSKRHLKQFTYFAKPSFGQPESFDNDLDLSVTLHISEEKKVIYVMSMYTEAMYCITPSEILEEDGIRFNEGIEYQIYRAV